MDKISVRSIYSEEDLASLMERAAIIMTEALVIIINPIYRKIL